MSRHNVTAKSCKAGLAVGMVGAGALRLSETIGPPRGPRPPRRPVQIGPPMDDVGAATGTAIGTAIGVIAGGWIGRGIAGDLQSQGFPVNDDAWGTAGEAVGGAIGAIVGWGAGSFLDWWRKLRQEMTGPTGARGDE
jgi:hypothetical protein